VSRSKKDRTWETKRGVPKNANSEGQGEKVEPGAGKERENFGATVGYNKGQQKKKGRLGYKGKESENFLFHFFSGGGNLNKEMEARDNSKGRGGQGKEEGGAGGLRKVNFTRGEYTKKNVEWGSCRRRLGGETYGKKYSEKEWKRGKKGP